MELFFNWRRLQRLGRWRKFVKGVAYPLYCRRLVRLVAQAKPDVLHYQWMRVPPVDLYVMRQIRRRSPITSIVVTMHNVQPLTAVTGHGYLERVLDLANGVVVHGRESKGQLLRKFPALNPSKVAVIPHGPLHMQTAREDARGQHPDRNPAGRKRVGLVFGEIKSYKGLDVLAEAVSLLTAARKAAASAGDRGEARGARLSGRSRTDRITRGRRGHEDRLRALCRRPRVLPHRGFCAVALQGYQSERRTPYRIVAGSIGDRVRARRHDRAHRGHPGWLERSAGEWSRFSRCLEDSSGSHE